VVILGGIFSGIVTPTEASVLGVLYTIVLGVAYKKFRWKTFIEELFNAMRTMTKVMFIVAAAALFGQVIIRTQMAAKLGVFMSTAFSSPALILFLINIFLLIVGCFLEQIAAILVVTPIFLPIMLSLGLSDIQCGLIIVFNLMIGLLTPPFGLVLFALADVAKISMKRTIKGVAPFLIPLFITLFIITYVPWVSDFLPNLLMGK
jgi:tripartite ATP-independent transporter DctM subunit